MFKMYIGTTKKDVGIPLLEDCSKLFTRYIGSSGIQHSVVYSTWIHVTKVAKRVY